MTRDPVEPPPPPPGDAEERTYHRPELREGRVVEAISWPGEEGAEMFAGKHGCKSMTIVLEQGFATYEHYVPYVRIERNDGIAIVPAHHLGWIQFESLKEES